MNYRPITDVWLLVRPKLVGGERYYGAYPSGFLSRARALLGVARTDAVLHVCSGKVDKHKDGDTTYDFTLDIDPALCPTFCQDAREPFPVIRGTEGWPAILIDPPYTPEDAAKYTVGATSFPTPKVLLNNALDAVVDGGKVGMLHYVMPSPGNRAKLVAAVAVIVGFNNRVRVFSVYQKL